MSKYFRSLFEMSELTQVEQIIESRINETIKTSKDVQNPQFCEYHVNIESPTPFDSTEEILKDVFTNITSKNLKSTGRGHNTLSACTIAGNDLIDKKNNRKFNVKVTFNAGYDNVHASFTLKLQLVQYTPEEKKQNERNQREQDRMDQAEFVAKMMQPRPLTEAEISNNNKNSIQTCIENAKKAASSTKDFADGYTTELIHWTQEQLLNILNQIFKSCEQTESNDYRNVSYIAEDSTGMKFLVQLQGWGQCSPREQRSFYVKVNVIQNTKDDAITERDSIEFYHYLLNARNTPVHNGKQDSISWITRQGSLADAERCLSLVTDPSSSSQWMCEKIKDIDCLTREISGNYEQIDCKYSITIRMVSHGYNNERAKICVQCRDNTFLEYYNYLKEARDDTEHNQKIFRTNQATVPAARTALRSVAHTLIVNPITNSHGDDPAKWSVEGKLTGNTHHPEIEGEYTVSIFQETNQDNEQRAMLYIQYIPPAVNRPIHTTPDTEPTPETRFQRFKRALRKRIGSS
jgi:hypothetical protein